MIKTQATGNKHFIRLAALFAAAALAACGSENGGNDNPCEGENPPAECEMSCTTGASCPDGFFCDVASGECRADCAIDDDWSGLRFVVRVGERADWREKWQERRREKTSELTH